MTLDIRGSLKNTRISKNPLVVVDELLANSIDAFLIRKRDEADAVALEVTLKVKATKADLLGEVYDLEITCEDNGCGLGPEQRKAFLTKDTEPRRVCRRLQLLSRMEHHEQDHEQVFP